MVYTIQYAWILIFNLCNKVFIRESCYDDLKKINSIDLYLTFFSIVPDCYHVTQTKNWLLKFVLA